MNILLKDYFSWCCVSGIKRNLYKKPITKQKMQWVSLPSASITTDTESKPIIRAGQNFSSGMFFLLETSLVSFLPSSLAVCLTGQWQQRAEEPSEPWPRIEFLDRSGSSCSPAPQLKGRPIAGCLALAPCRETRASLDLLDFPGLKCIPHFVFISEILPKWEILVSD